MYDLTRKPWNRVVQLDVLCTMCRVPSYEPLEMDKVYKVILPSYLVSGGDGFQMIKDELLKHDSGKYRYPLPLLRLAQQNWADGARKGNLYLCCCSLLLWRLLTTVQHWGVLCSPFPSTHVHIYLTQGKAHRDRETYMELAMQTRLAWYSQILLPKGCD